MQQLSHPKMDWQSEPIKTLDSNTPEKEDEIFENSKKVLLKHQNNVFKMTRYPDVRFSCHLCGSLDVMVRLDIFSTPCVTKCLDCGVQHIEFQAELEDVKICLC